MLLIGGIAFTTIFAACGEESSEDKEEKKKGPSLCDCVNAMDEPSDECKQMEEEWKEKFKNASEEEQQAMMKEFEACK